MLVPALLVAHFVRVWLASRAIRADRRGLSARFCSFSLDCPRLVLQERGSRTSFSSSTRGALEATAIPRGRGARDVVRRAPGGGPLRQAASTARGPLVVGVLSLGGTAAKPEGGQGWGARRPSRARSLGRSPIDARVVDRRFDEAAHGDRSARAHLFRLAPTEKLVLLRSVSARSPSRARRSRAPTTARRGDWYGRCNGIATASMERARAPPDRGRPVHLTVHLVRFSSQRREGPPRRRLLRHARGVRPRRSVWVEPFRRGASSAAWNAATLVLLTLNWLGRRHETFLVDAVPSRAIQFYAVADARVAYIQRGPVSHRQREGRSWPSRETSKTLRCTCGSELGLSSTTLPDSAADVIEPDDRDGSALRARRAEARGQGLRRDSGARRREESLHRRALELAIRRRGRIWWRFRGSGTISGRTG